MHSFAVAAAVLLLFTSGQSRANGAALARFSRAVQEAERIGTLGRQASTAAQAGWVLAADPGLIRDSGVLEMFKGGPMQAPDLSPRAQELLADPSFGRALTRHADTVDGWMQRLRSRSDCDPAEEHTLRESADLIDDAAARAGIASAPLPSAPFQDSPFAKPNSGTRFAILGDAGTGLQSQWDIAKQVTDAHQGRNFDGVIMLGDNVYPYGEPWKFDDRIRRPYGDLFDDGVPAYAVLGNHDVAFSLGWDQLRYLGHGTNRYWDTRLAGGRIHLIGIDTNVIAGEDKLLQGMQSWAGEFAEEQRAWLAQTLHDSDAEWKIVVGHHPLYGTGGSNAKGQTRRMRSDIEDLFKANKVDAYLSGHEHHYERSTAGGIQHILLGSSGALPEAPEGASALADVKPEVVHTEGAWATLELEGNDLRIHVSGEGGRTLDSVVIPKASP